MEVAEAAVEVAEAAVVGVVPPQYGAEGVVVAEVLTVARGPALAAVAANDVAAVAVPAADCGEWGAVVELRAASVAAAGPAVAVEAGPRAGRPAVARIADHRG